MKKYTKKGIKNIEYTFEDWLKVYEEEGLFPKKHKFFSTPIIRGIKHVDNKTIKTGIPEDEYRKIVEKRKEIFNNDIERVLVYLISSFDNYINQVKDKARFKEATIDIYNKIIDFAGCPNLEDYFPQNRNIFVHFDLRELNEIRSNYFEILVVGNKDVFLSATNEDAYFNYVNAIAILEFLQWIKNEENAKQTDVFDQNLLSVIHKEFNNEEIWEPISLSDFLDSFQGKGNKIKFKGRKQAEFCFILGQIEKHRNKGACPNFHVWVKNTFNIPEYKTQKKDTKKELRSETKSKMIIVLKQNGLS